MKAERIKELLDQQDLDGAAELIYELAERLDSRRSNQEFSLQQMVKAQEASVQHLYYPDLEGLEFDRKLHRAKQAAQALEDEQQ